MISILKSYSQLYPFYYVVRRAHNPLDLAGSIGTVGLNIPRSDNGGNLLSQVLRCAHFRMSVGGFPGRAAYAA
jgi:hypothetical protein